MTIKKLLFAAVLRIADIQAIWAAAAAETVWQADMSWMDADSFQILWKTVDTGTKTSYRLTEIQSDMFHHTECKKKQKNQMMRASEGPAWV